MIDRLEQLMAKITNSVLPGAYLVEFFPSMMRIPSWAAKWKRDGERLFREGDEMFTELFERTSAGVALNDGANLPDVQSFAARLLATDGKVNLSRQEAIWLAGAML